MQDIITAIRTIRSENNIPPDKQGKAVIIPSDQETSDWIASQISLVNQFSKLSETAVGVNTEKPKFAGSSVVMGTQVYLCLEGLIDKQVEIERLTKEIDRVRNLAEGTKKRLSNESFISRAPEDVVAKEKEKLQGLLTNLEKLEKNIAALRM